MAFGAFQCYPASGDAAWGAQTKKVSLCGTEGKTPPRENPEKPVPSWFDGVCMPTSRVCFDPLHARSPCRGRNICTTPQGLVSLIRQGAVHTKRENPTEGQPLQGKPHRGTTLTRAFGLLVAGHFDAYQMRHVQPFTIVRRPRAVLLSTRWVSVALMSPSVDKVNNTDETHRLWVS